MLLVAYVFRKFYSLLGTVNFLEIMINSKYDSGCLSHIPEYIEAPPFEVLIDFINSYVVEEITEPCVDVMCPRGFGRSILRNTLPSDISIAFHSCEQVGYSLADMTPDIQYWLKVGLHRPDGIARFTFELSGKP